jgi:hypothetical protein
MTDTNTKKKAAGASNTNGLHTDANNLDFVICEAFNQAHHGKAIAIQLEAFVKQKGSK